MTGGEGVGAPLIGLPPQQLHSHHSTVYYQSCQTPGKTKLYDETAKYCSPDSSKFFGTPCILNKTTLIIICHYSVCVIRDLFKADRST